MLREVKALVAGLAALVVLVVPGAARADFSGDGPADVLTVHPDGRLLMYRGNGAGGWAPNVPDAIGTGWGSFTAFLAPGDFSGDGKPDVLVRDGDGRLLDVPRQRRRRLGRGRPADRSAAAGAASPRWSRPATSAATASPTSSRAIPPARC